MAKIFFLSIAPVSIFATWAGVSLLWQGALGDGVLTTAIGLMLVFFAIMLSGEAFMRKTHYQPMHERFAGRAACGRPHAHTMFLKRQRRKPLLLTRNWWEVTCDGCNGFLH